MPERPQPLVLVLAGPNGSGKTTLQEQYRADAVDLGLPSAAPELYINPDVIRRSPEIKALRGSALDLDLAAQNAAYLRRQELMAAGESFVFETVMSHPSRLVELEQLREKGYQVVLAFVATRDPDINVRRVNYRVFSGTTTGHDVPEDRVRARYARTLALLPAAIELADETFIYDNSIDLAPSTLQATVQRDTGETDTLRWAAIPAAEAWVRQALGALEDRNRERAMYEQSPADLAGEPVLANTLESETVGEYVDLTRHYFGLIDQHLGRIHVHDRLRFMPEQLVDLASQVASCANALVTIRYAPGCAPLYRIDPKTPRERGRPRLTPIG
jgi:predicted ABC-type ATPase